MLKPVSAILVLAVAACVPNDRLDANCTPDEPSVDQNRDCNRSDGLGPGVLVVCDAIQDEPASDPTWDDVKDILTSEAKGRCSDTAGCHGDAATAAIGLHLPADDDQALYDALINTTGRQGVPYLIPGDPGGSWMHCNLRNRNFDGGVGKAMPLGDEGLPDDADVLLIEDWILQGAVGPP